MAGLGAKLFTAFSKLTAAQVNGYLMDQSIMRFANAAARDAAFGGAGEPTLAEGMTCYLDDTNVVQSYTGSAWVSLAGFVGNCAVKISSPAAISNGADSVVSWASATYDNDTMFSAGTPNRVTVKTAGIYVVTSTIVWPSNNTGERISWIQLNGSTATRWGNRRGGAWSSGPTEYSIAAQIKCAVNDYIQLGVYQSSGGSLDLQSAGTGGTQMEVARIAVP